MTDTPAITPEAVERDEVGRAIKRMEALGRFFMGADDVEEASLCYADAHLFRQMWAALTASEARAERLQPWAVLGEMVMDGWPETGDIDGFDLQTLAVEAGVLREIPGGYDPDRHIDSVGVAPEKGDPWYEIVQSPPTTEIETAAAQAREDALREALEVIPSASKGREDELERGCNDGLSEARQVILELLDTGEERRS